MTGMPTLLVQLEDAVGAFTNDITAYVNLKPGWSARRGRNDEDSTVEPGRLELQLDNSDGKFTLGSASFNGITADKRIRVSETVGGVTTRRHVGYVQDWPTEWESPLGNMAVVRVTSMDRLGRLNRRKLRSAIENEHILAGARAYYTLGEVAGSLTAGDTSGFNQPSLTAGYGSVDYAWASPPIPGVPVTFGTGIGPGTDGLTAAVFNSSAAVTAQHLETQRLAVGTFPGLSLSVWFTTTLLGATETLAFLGDYYAFVDGVSININSSGFLFMQAVSAGLGAAITSPAAVTDGLLHHALVTWDGTTTRAYLDNVAIGSTACAGTPTIIGKLAVGPRYGGTLSHVGVFPTTLSVGQVASINAAGVNGFATERADQRIARLAAYANIAVADQTLETGAQASIAAAATNGQNALPAMNDVADAEGGLVFMAGDGQLILQNKSHRPLKATQTAALAITAADVVPGSFKFAGAKDYLVNDATSTRPSGAEQRSINAASLAAYEQYPGNAPTTLLPTDGLVLDRLTWLTTMYGTPRSRVKEFTLDLLTLPQATVQAALALEIGDRVSITSLPTQAPSSPDLLIEGITEEQQASVGSKPKWEITFNTVPAALFQPWILGDATYGQLGITTRLYF